MRQDDLSQIKQDMERLVVDVKRLMTSDDKACCSNPEGGIACDSPCGSHRHVWTYLGLTALAAGIAGALIAKKQSS